VDILAIENHKYIKLIEFSIKNRHFTKSQACKESGLKEKDFDFIMSDIFILSGAHSTFVSAHEDIDWKLSPHAFFNYLQFVEFKHAVVTAKRAHNTAIAAIIISGMLALGSLIATVTS